VLSAQCPLDLGPLGGRYEYLRHPVNEGCDDERTSPNILMPAVAVPPVQLWLAHVS
jgi:hypothetical protein